MPQFDFYSFSVQVFWALPGFFLFYFFLTFFGLSNISESLKFRYNLNLSLEPVIDNGNNSVRLFFHKFIKSAAKI